MSGKVIKFWETFWESSNKISKGNAVNNPKNGVQNRLTTLYMTDTMTKIAG